MKNTTRLLIYLLFFQVIALIGCSDGTIAEYRPLEEFSITIDEEQYTCAIGDKLSIEPEIYSQIPESDLLFYWEVGHGEGYGDHTTFTPFAQTKNLDMECRLGELFPAPATYTLRIRVKQISSGRDFYSKHFKLRITGQTGLMVLYDTNGESDIALIRNLADSNATMHCNFYSDANDGRKIPGTGRFMTQLQGGTISFANYHSVIVVTDKSSVGADYLTMEEIPGGWDRVLFKGAFNRGIPENIIYSSWNPMEQFQEVYIIDGGEIYGRQNSEFVLRPAIGTSSNAYINTYDLEPYAYASFGSNYRVWLFDKKSRAFIGITNTIAVFMNGAANPASVFKIFVPGGAFNPSRMRADLIYMAEGGAPKHLLAIMKRDNGELFVAELDTQPTDPSETAKAIYEFDTRGLGEILGYDFCSHLPSRECCYFFTADNIYRLSMNDDKSVATPCPVIWPEHQAVLNNEVITDMVTLPCNGASLMVVGSWNGTEAKAKIFAIDSDSGNLAKLLSTHTIPGKISAFHLKHI